jgi:HMG (high mobility group) box
MVSAIFFPHCPRRHPAKRRIALGIRLTWTDPVETLAAPQPRQIAFAPAVTPGTYTDEPSSLGSAESSPSLFPSTLDGAGPKKPGHGKKKAEDHIPRPPNAFILFRSSFIKSRHVSTEVETNHSTLSKIIGLTWQNMPHEERQFWHCKAKTAQAEHKRKFPDYAFRPSHVKAKGGAGGGGGGGSTNSEKRKVREVGPKDMKRCAKIAQLLIEGKKGADLQAAVQEFDKNHVPTVVTRFDTPITARSFRRSLSEPAPDTDPSAPAFLRSDPKPSSRRLRATSSQPNMSRPSTPRMEEPVDSSAASPSSAHSVFSSSPFANLAENADALSEATWSDMPPLVLPPAGPVDTSLVPRHAPSLVSVTYFVFMGCVVTDVVLHPGLQHIRFS